MDVYIYKTPIISWKELWIWYSICTIDRTDVNGQQRSTTDSSVSFVCPLLQDRCIKLTWPMRQTFHWTVHTALSTDYRDVCPHCMPEPHRVSQSSSYWAALMHLTHHTNQKEEFLQGILHGSHTILFITKQTTHNQSNTTQFGFISVGYRTWKITNWIKVKLCCVGLNKCGLFDMALLQGVKWINHMTPKSNKAPMTWKHSLSATA